MEIIIVGCGKVGYAIAKNLSSEKNTNITLIDNRADFFEKAAESLDVMLIKGNGLNANSLLEAGAKDADLIISVTGTDETNILCCILAKSLGTKHTIARVRGTEYDLDLNKFWKYLGLDLIINPEQHTAHEISRSLRFPGADEIDTFVNGRVELVSLKVAEAKDFFVGKSVSEIFHKRKSNILLAVVERGNNAVIPHGDLIFEQDDIIRVIGRPHDIMDFFALTGRNTEKIKKITVIGGSRIAHYLINLLHRYSGAIDITIIEKNKEKCESLSESFPRCLILHGDGTDEDILFSANVYNSGAIICLTDRDEENTIIALYSLQMGVKKVIAKINHINRKMVSNLGLGTIVSPQNTTSEQIIYYVRGLSGAYASNIKTVYKLFDNENEKVEAVEHVITENAKCLNTPLKDLKLKKGILIGCIIRNSNIIIPSGEVYIENGDSVIIISKNCNIYKLDDILE